MKTTNSNIRKMANLTSGLLLFGASFIFLSGCQKEEMLTPTGELRTAASAERNIVPVATVPFTMITIDHQAAQSTQPDYYVSVKTTGEVTFIGRKNTVVKGLQKFTVPMQTVTMLNKLFLNGHFNEIVNDITYERNLPMVITSFATTSNMSPRIQYDYNRGYPAELIRIRTTAEEILVISRLVSGTEIPGPVLDTDGPGIE